MTGWTTVLLACGLAYGLKLLGYLVPQNLLDGPRISQVVRLLPVALLSALVAVQAFTGDGGALTLDARLCALAVAIIALLLRAPFLVVVLAAAITAAALRAFGIG